MGSTALARVIEYTDGSEKAARELLEEYLNQDRIRWGYWKIEFEGDHAWRWTEEAARRFFWWRHRDGRIESDWSNSCATRTGPVFIAIGKKGAQVLHDGPQTVLRVHLFCICWDDVFDILQSLGFSPRSTAVPALTSPPFPPPEKSAAPTPVKPKPSKKLKPARKLKKQPSLPQADPFPDRHRIRRPLPDDKCKGWVVAAAKVVPKPTGVGAAWFKMLAEASGERWNKATIERQFYQQQD